MSINNLRRSLSHQLNQLIPGTEKPEVQNQDYQRNASRAKTRYALTSSIRR